MLGAQAARGAEAGDGQQAGRNETGAGGEGLRPGGGEEVGAEEGGGGAASGDTEERGRHFGVWFERNKGGSRGVRTGTDDGTTGALSIGLAAVFPGEELAVQRQLIGC